VEKEAKKPADNPQKKPVPAPVPGLPPGQVVSGQAVLDPPEDNNTRQPPGSGGKGGKQGSGGKGSGGKGVPGGKRVPGGGGATGPSRGPSFPQPKPPRAVSEPPGPGSGGGEESPIGGGEKEALMNLNSEWTSPRLRYGILRQTTGLQAHSAGHPREVRRGAGCAGKSPCPGPARQVTSRPRPILPVPSVTRSKRARVRASRSPGEDNRVGNGLMSQRGRRRCACRSASCSPEYVA
jgi:hypothetical protein